MEDIKRQRYETNISHTIELLEKYLGKALSSNEFDIVRSWYDASLYPHEAIVANIEEVGPSGKFSLKFLERTLNREKYTAEPFDEKAERAIDEIFKAI